MTLNFVKNSKKSAIFVNIKNEKMDNMFTEDMVDSTILDYLRKNPDNRKRILYNLLADESLSISELIKIKEDSMKAKIDDMKGDLSEGSAIALMYMKNIHSNGQEKNDLDDRAHKFIKKLGFFNV